MRDASSIALLEDMEDLLEDTKKRLVSARDVYTSNEVKEDDIVLCHKNMKEFDSIFSEFMTVREISKHTVEMRKKFHEIVLKKLDLYPELEKLTQSLFKKDILEVSSLVAPYSHLECSSQYLAKSHDYVDSKGIPNWVAKDCRLPESPNRFTV